MYEPLKAADTITHPHICNLTNIGECR